MQCICGGASGSRRVPRIQSRVKPRRSHSRGACSDQGDPLPLTTHVPNSILDSRPSTWNPIQAHTDRTRSQLVDNRIYIRPPCALQHTCYIRLLLFTSVKTLHSYAPRSTLNYKKHLELSTFNCLQAPRQLASIPRNLFAKNTNKTDTMVRYTRPIPLMNTLFIRCNLITHQLIALCPGPNSRAAPPKRKVRQGAGVSHGQVRRSDQEARQGDAQGSYFPCLDWSVPLLLLVIIRELPISQRVVPSLSQSAWHSD